MKKLIFFLLLITIYNFKIFSISNLLDIETRHKEEISETCVEILALIRSNMLCCGERISVNHDKGCKDNIEFWATIYAQICKEEKIKSSLNY